MASSEASEGVAEEEEEKEEDLRFWNLDTIPKELFLHICTFLSMKFVINVLSQVCTRFKCLIEDDSTWKIRLFTRWPSRYPIIKGDNFCWNDACCEREEQDRLWCDNGANMKMYHMKGAHFGSVDVIHLIEKGKFCASGARDQSIKLWNLEELNEHQPDSDIDLCSLNVHQRDAAHKGWIWSMAYSEFDKHLFSGSWDSYIKCWDANDFTTPKETFSSMKSPVLCLALSENVLISGCYDRRVSFFDLRTGPEPIFSDSLHRQAVLCLAVDDKFVISGSEDRSVVVFDKRAGKISAEIEFCGYPMSMSYAQDHLWVGDNLGYLHVIDPTGEKFELFKGYRSGHRSQVSGLHYSLGSVITSSLDKSVIVHEPTDELKPIATFTFKSGVAGISGYKDILASANSDDSITVWLPKTAECG